MLATNRNSIAIGMVSPVSGRLRKGLLRSGAASHLSARALRLGETGRRRPLAQPGPQEKEGPPMPYQHLCDDCGYRYTTHCPLCKDHNRPVKRWRAIEDLARAWVEEVA